MHTYEKCQALNPVKIEKFIKGITRHSHIQLFAVSGYCIVQSSISGNEETSPEIHQKFAVQWNSH